MKCDRTDYGALAVLAPRGDLTGDDVEGFGHDAARCLEGSAGLIVDCAGLTSVDSTGLESLAELSRRCQSRGGMLKLCRPDAVLRKILEMTRLERQFELFDDVEAAIRSHT